MYPKKIKPPILSLDKVILKLRNLYPPDNMIITYKDYKTHRDYLFYYQFNPKVFESLINLIYEIWNSKERINRTGMLELAKRYYLKRGDYEIKGEPLNKLFRIFCNLTITCNPKLKKGPNERATVAANGMLLNRVLSNIQLVELCENAEHSYRVLNRVLRYPVKSKIISRWARKNFENDNFRTRRAEMIGLILDENPEFEVCNKMLVDDFEYQNKIDSKLIKNYIKRLIKWKLPIGEFERLNQWNLNYYIGMNDRYYNIPESDEKIMDLNFPDINKLRSNWYKEINKTKNITMIWSFIYSHLDQKTKVEKIKQYYSPNASNTFYKAAMRLQSLELFMFLKEKSEQEIKIKKIAKKLNKKEKKQEEEG